MTLLRELLQESDDGEITPEKILQDVGYVFSRSNQQLLGRLAKKPPEQWTKNQQQKFEELKQSYHHAMNAKKNTSK